MSVEPGNETDPEEQELSYENALLLLGEFEEVIDDLEEADGDEADSEHVRELVERLVQSLDDLPVSSELARQRVENVESWASVLVSEDPESEAGPGGIPTLIRDELAELRGVLEYEMTT